MAQERSERVSAIINPTRKVRNPRTLVRGTVQSPDVDEIALLLQPIKDTRVNYGGSTGKLIQL